MTILSTSKNHMRQLLFAIFALMLSFSAAYAQGTASLPQTSGSGTGIQQQPNPITPFYVRQCYWKRCPGFARLAGPRKYQGYDLLTPVYPGLNLQQSAGKYTATQPALSMPTILGGAKASSGPPANGNWTDPVIYVNSNAPAPPQAAVIAYKEADKLCDGGFGMAYHQSPMIANDMPATYRDLELFSNMLTTYGMPISDTQFQIIDRENKQRYLELYFDPERWMWLFTATTQLQGSASSNMIATTSEETFNTAYDRIIQGDSSAGSGGGGNGALINVANELAASSGGNGSTVPQCIYKVQQMYKQVFIPMAILLLLPGAIITQTKSFVSHNFWLSRDDSSNPFEGILRAMVAVFLIPATQVIVSYAIDTGNSLAYSVQPWINKTTIFNWANQQIFTTLIGNEENAVISPTLTGSTVNGSAIVPGQGVISAQTTGTSGNGQNGLGKAADQSRNQTVMERQLWLSMIVQLGFNLAETLMSYSIVLFSAFQLVMMCYLFLLGPIAAAFFAWPSGVGKNLFRQCFGTWLNGVTVLSLWRFYWAVILAIMTQRINYLQSSAGYTPNAEVEMIVFACFLGLMLYVPFAPFSFDPGMAATQVLERGGQALQGVTQGVMKGAKDGGLPAGQLNKLAQYMAPAATVAGTMRSIGSQMMNTRMANAGAGLGVSDLQNQGGGGSVGPFGASGGGSGSGYSDQSTQPQMPATPGSIQPTGATSSTQVPAAPPPPSGAAATPITGSHQGQPAIAATPSGKGQSSIVPSSTSASMPTGISQSGWAAQMAPYLAGNAMVGQAQMIPATSPATLPLSPIAPTNSGATTGQITPYVNQALAGLTGNAITPPTSGQPGTTPPSSSSGTPQTAANPINNPPPGQQPPPGNQPPPNKSS